MILDYVIYRYPFSSNVSAEVWDIQSKETYCVLAGTDYNEVKAKCERLCVDTDDSTYIECGCCGAYHRSTYYGDCRNDIERFDDIPPHAVIVSEKEVPY